jgi:LDH2 family malate/lactate/ureidoglycolate dehydrogenase
VAYTTSIAQTGEAIRALDEAGAAEVAARRVARTLGEAECRGFASGRTS